MASEFKISRLRYDWVGEWETTTTYKRDDLVQYEGKTYICLEPHTSTSNFYDALYFPVTPYWELMVDGRKWKNAWEPLTQYSLGNIVQYGGLLYICSEAHTSGANEIDTSKWQIFSRAGKWNSDWETNTVYGIDDIVKYGGIVYKCIDDHVSAGTTSDGLEVDLSKWTILNRGVEYKGSWDQTTRYRLNDIVQNGSNLWICILGHTSTNSFDESKWNTWIPGLDYTDTWENTTTYQPGDTVIYGGYSYISITVNNTGNIPSIESDNWDLLTQGYDLQNDWSFSTNYKIGDVVRRGGYLFVANEDNSLRDPIGNEIQKSYNSTGSSGKTLVISSLDSTFGDVYPGMIVIGNGFSKGQTVVSWDGDTTVTLNEEPDGVLVDGQSLTFSGINGEYWTLLSTGTRWRGFWQTNTNYIPGDLAFWDDRTYQCIRTTSSSSNPKLDTTNLYWITFVEHDRRNAMNAQGDIVYFDGTDNVPLPISTQETEVLKSVNNAPSWETIFITPNVFYVATNGSDADDYPDRGKTWDHPWRTIRHACDTISEGFQFLDTKNAILDNKAWLLEEMWQWMEYQKANSIAPYSPSSAYDETKTRRDASFVIDAIVYDISRGGNSQTVATAKSFFEFGSTNTFFNAGTAAKMPFFIPALEYLLDLINNVLSDTEPTVNYQEENGIAEGSQILQVRGYFLEEATIDDTINELFNYIVEALDNQSTLGLPVPNQGLTATIFVKSGTYTEELPIVVPANVAVVGDELRGTVVQPANIINMYATGTVGFNNTVTVISTEGLQGNMPIQFISTGNTLDNLQNINVGQTYYVLGDTITSTSFSFSETVGGTAVDLNLDLGKMYVYGGDALKDMFRMRDSTGLRNMTLTGLLGTLTELNEFLTQRPTGGSYVSLDPGEGPDDTSAWIYRRSPYIQNVTNFGMGCTGLKIDGTLHNGGNKSIVCNDFTQILSDGIGIWVTGSGSLCEAVSVFSYYNYAGYFAEDGGRLRATNGNSSYGTFGVIAEGFDDNEVPITGKIDNRSGQAVADVQSSFGLNSLLLRLQYTNAGSEYTTATTNMLNYSNDFVNGWTTDGNILLAQNQLNPINELSNAWTVTGTTSTTDSSYIYQDVTITPPGSVYTGLSAINITGSGSLATFDVTVNATGYSVTVNNGGTGYVATNQMFILGSELGGRDGVNNLTITVATLSGSSIQTVTSSGTVPTGSAMQYTLSVYAKKNTAPEIDIYAIFSGTSTKGSALTYNFDTDTLTPTGQQGSGLVPTLYGRQEFNNGWVRLWFSVYDVNALNNNLQYRIYPRGKENTAGSTYFYGTQLQIHSGSPTFYLETRDNRYTSFANYEVTGAGTGAVIVGDEIRSDSVFQVRITDDNNLGEGGTGYLTGSNNAQGGDEHYIVLSAADINEASNYERMRLFISSGTGAGQYGRIGNYNSSNKYAYMLKESFTPVTVVSSSSSTNAFTFDSNFDTNGMYVNMPVQFIPTVYQTEVTSASQAELTATTVLGGLINTITVNDTTRLTVGTPVSFSGTVFGGLIESFTYYVSNIIDSTTIQVSTTLFGETLFLQNGSGSMTLLYPASTNYFFADSTADMLINMPIQFTGVSIGFINIGTTYYINDIVDANNFTISNSLVNITITATNSTGNVISTSDTGSLVRLNPIVFSGTGSNFGNIVKGTKYYINSIVNSTTFTISDTLISVACTATAATSNLITVSNTAGFVADQPIKFVGTTFGGLISGQLYYILAINNSTTFTVSTTIGGSSVTLTTAVGECEAKTVSTAKPLVTASGSLTGRTTSPQRTLTSGTGSMTATFYTEVFGGIVTGTDYYVYSITPGNPSTMQITATSGGVVPVNLQNATGSMQFGEVGWDHVNPGSPIEPTLDSSTSYFIEARPEFSHPGFTQAAGTPVSLAPGTTWIDVAYGDHYWIAIPDGNQTAMGSSNGTSWASITLPIPATDFKAITYGNKYWVILTDSAESVESGSKVLFSNSRGDAWRISYLPSKTTWSCIAYGNGVFVALANGTSTSSYSVDHGKTWVSGSGLPNQSWTSVTYGSGMFIAVASGTSTAAMSTNGQTWTSITLPISTSWSDIAFGDDKFLAISTDLAESAYTFDGIDWYLSKIDIQADKLAYGNGVFLALYSSGGTTAYTTDDCIIWKTKTVSNITYDAVAFGFAATTYDGGFVTVANTNSSTIIKTGTKTKGRVSVTSGAITEIGLFETGGGYTTAPTLNIIDPNISIPATFDIRTSNGVLSGPTFVNRGTGYNTNTTTVNINGDGFADEYQTGLSIYCKDVSKLPRPGDNLVIDNNSTVYKVTNATALNGTVAPNLEVELQISPPMTVALSPDHNTDLEIRQLYSQVRLTGHDFLNIGFGNFEQSNYPDLPTGTELSPQNEAIENNFGRVFFTSTDQDGNFKVGNLFGVEQATGIVTLSASQFGLEGLEVLRLGGVAVGGSSVVITQFSTDPTFIANSNTVIPTQKAIRSYLTGRLSQGGSNTFTGQATAGTVIIGGPDRIANTIPEGIPGSSVKMLNKVNVSGPNAAVAGDMEAFFRFTGTWWRPA